MPRSKANSLGEQTRAAVESAVSRSRAIIAEADSRGDTLVRDALALTADKREARTSALNQAHRQVSTSVDQTTTELQRFAAMLRVSANDLQAKARTRS